jgi:hypothetical protein
LNKEDAGALGSGIVVLAIFRQIKNKNKPEKIIFAG